MKKIGMVLFLSIILPGCSASTVEADAFLSQVLLKNGVYVWSPGTGDSLEGWSVTSIAVQNGGKTITIHTDQTPPAMNIFTYESADNANQAYYKNTVRYTPEGTTDLFVSSRYVGIQIANGRLVWTGYITDPRESDWATIADQSTFESFVQRFWGKDQVNFYREKAVLGL